MLLLSLLSSLFIYYIGYRDFCVWQKDNPDMSDGFLALHALGTTCIAVIPILFWMTSR